MNSNIKKIGLLGGDMRQIRLASLLAAEGYETAIWGFRQAMEDEKLRSMLSGCVRCADWESAVRASGAVLLPLPVSLDGVRLNCPLAASDGEIRLTEIIEKTTPGTLVLGGKIPSLIRRLAAEQGLLVYDYYESEALQIRNSVPTAEGAIAVAIEELPVVLQGSRALVTGYGRIGRSLAKRLIALGVRVYVAARSGRDLAWAESEGCIPVKLSDYREKPTETDIIFNTVPAMIFDSSLLGKLPKTTLIVELATANSGVEMKNDSGIRIISAQGLPGKRSPWTAGEIIFETVKDYLEENTGKQRLQT